MIKTTDVSVLEECRDMLPKDTIGFDPVALMKQGFCLVLGQDVGLFELVGPSVYRCHYFFRSRGRDALRTAREMVSWMFEREGAHVLSGLTPTDNKGALWITRQLGSRFLDIIKTDVGDMQTSMLTQKDFK